MFHVPKANETPLPCKSFKQGISDELLYEKRITQIEIRIYQYTSKTTGDTIEQYYLLLRCNAGMIMGESPVLALDMNKYTKDEIIERLQKGYMKSMNLDF